MARKQPEQELVHRPIVNYLRSAYPDVLFHHSPNGGWRRPLEAKIFKGLGVQPGFPDIFIYEPRKDFHGLAIECKAPGKLKGQSTHQKLILQMLANRGYKVSVVDNFYDARDLIDDYLKV